MAPAQRRFPVPQVRGTLPVGSQYPPVGRQSLQVLTLALLILAGRRRDCRPQFGRKPSPSFGLPPAITPISAEWC